MPATVAAVIGAKLKLPNGKEVTLHEGDVVRDLIYKSGTEDKSISGTVRVINATTKNYTSGTSSCPPEPYVHKYVTIGSLIIDSSAQYDAELTKVSISNIVDIGGVTENGGAITVGVGEQYKPLADVIASAPEGAVINLKGGEYEAPLALNKSITIVGDGTAVLTGPLTINAAPAVARVAGEKAEPVVVHLEGVELAKDAIITADGIDELELVNCTFGELNDTGDKIYPVKLGENPVLLTVEGCTFKDQFANVYNILELNCQLKDGSRICNNRFEGKSCTHNQINLYNVVDGATITIENNWCAMSANLLRIGFKGAPADVVVNVNNNTCDATSDDDWAGLMIIQPYGNKTTSYAGLTVNLKGNTCPGEQLAYVYSSKDGMHFTEETNPTIVVNGEVVTLVDRNPQ